MIETRFVHPLNVLSPMLVKLSIEGGAVTEARYGFSFPIPEIERNGNESLLWQEMLLMDPVIWIVTDLRTQTVWPFTVVSVHLLFVSKSAVSS